MPASNPSKNKPEQEKPISKQKAITNSNREWANLEQYMLTQNIDKIENYYLNNQNLFNYFTFRQINGRGPQIINKLRGIDNIDVFYKMKTSALSLMQPKIRIYKVNYEDFEYGPDGTPDENTITSLPTPCYKEFKFSDNFGQETAATVEDYLAYESTKPNFRNVGLKSFSAVQDGRSHGVIENNIECKLELTFKSLKDLNASPPGEPNLRYVDFILWPPARYTKNSERINPMHYQIKVFLGYAAPSAEQLNALNLSAKDITAIANIEKLNTVYSLSLMTYDIKIKDNGQVLLTATYRGRLETTVGSNQVNIFQDSFRIGTGGDYEVLKTAKAEYNTSHIYDLSTSIQAIYEQFAEEACIDDSCTARRQLRSLVSNNKIFADLIKGVLKVKNKKLREVGLRRQKDRIRISGEGDVFFTWFKTGDNAETLLAALKQKVGAFKSEIFKTFVGQLLEGNDTSDFRKELGTRLFCFGSSPKKVLEATGRKATVTDIGSGPGEGMSQPGEGLSAGEGASQLADIDPSAEQLGITVGRCNDTDEMTAAIASETAEEIKGDLAGTSQANDSQDTTPAPDDARRSTFNTGEKYNFYFLYLGDIIELACKNARLGQLDFDNKEKSIFPWRQYVPENAAATAPSYPLQNARVLLGPMEYKAADGKIKSINLAQFPVSFKFFRAWFSNKITRRRRSQMPLGEFLSLLINTLVLPGLYAGMPKSSKPRRTRTSIIAMSLPGMQVAGSGKKACGKKGSKLEEMLPLKRRLDLDSSDFKDNYFSKITQPRSSESLVKTSYDYLLMYMTTAKDITERSGDPAEDVKDGIYHFNIGSDMGLLKSMSFKRVNIPGLKEDRSEQAANGGVDQLTQLKLPYNTGLKLVGTSLFTPGMFYYVNPSLAGLGSVEDASSLAYQMHIGGYHLILKTSVCLSRGKFETTIEGMQQ